MNVADGDQMSLPYTINVTITQLDQSAAAGAPSNVCKEKMIMRFRGAWWLIASALLVAGCGGSNTVTTLQTTLAVSSITPATGSTGVAVTAPVTATFNEVMNGTTVTAIDLHARDSRRDRCNWKRQL